MAMTPATGGTMPRSCEVTFKGPTSTSLWLFVYGIPRIATTTMPAMMRSTPIQASGRNEASEIGITYAGAGRASLQGTFVLAVHQLPVRDPMRTICIRALPSLEIFSIITVRAFKPHRFRIPLERQYVRRDSVEKPPIV